jgi:hypothetical protein
MKKANKKLHLQLDVLRVLQAPDLSIVIGGLNARPPRPSATTERVGACCA